MKHLKTFALLLVVMALFTACGADGGGTSVSVSDVGNVEGTVTDATSCAVVSGATVQVGDKSAITNSSGVYSVTDLAVGSRTITATKTNYQNYNGTVTVTKGATVTQNIQMLLIGLNDNTSPANTTVSDFINGSATSTNLTSTTLSISATDTVGIIAYYISETSTLPSVSDSGWTTVTSATSYSANVSYNLSTGEGIKTVYVWFKDGTGNVSSAVSDSIILSQTWALATVDSTGNEQCTSVALDSNNKVHISYQDTTNFVLRYATNASGVWVASTIDSTRGMGYFTSIAIDSNDKVHISYYDGDNRTLKYATNTSGAWTTYTIDSTANVGYYTSIAVDSNNNIHISYFDYTNKDLKYATNSAGSWSFSTIDSTGEIGWYPSIEIDSNNKVHISYYDGTNYTLKYATNSSGSWATYIIDNTGSYMWDARLGLKTSIAIDSGNKVHISYYDLTNQNLKYATNTTGSWLTTTIDSSGDQGFYNSMSIDSQDKVHISYVDVSLVYLKYATNISGTWTTYTIDKEIADGWTSIAIDTNNKAHISYSTYDPEQYGALRYATNQ